MYQGLWNVSAASDSHKKAHPLGLYLVELEDSCEGYKAEKDNYSKTAIGLSPASCIQERLSSERADKKAVQIKGVAANPHTNARFLRPEVSAIKMFKINYTDVYPIE